MDNSVIFTIIILLLLIILFVAVSLGNKRVSITKKKHILTKLEELRLTSSSQESSVRRDSIIKLDNLLSKSLQYYFKNSNLCGENLKIASKIFKKKEYNDLWDVHKIRNRIVHDDYDITQQEAENVYGIYKMSILKILK